MCQSSRLFPYVLVTKTKHSFFQVPQQLGSVYWRGWTNFWKNKTLHGSSFVYTGTAEPWKFLNGNVCKFFDLIRRNQKKDKIEDRTVPLLRGLLLTVQVFEQFAG